ncbi:MAG TPA: hypothetical protein VFI44_11940 [Ornithinibacter sp.]|nr:hypothetical protein [Ornithinibacter sp.]
MTGERRRRFTTVAAGGLVLLLLALATVAGVRWWRDSHRTDLQRAVAYSPETSARWSWTDWAAVRAELGADVGEESTGLEVAELLNEGYDADLTSTTAMGESAEVLQERFGFSPATVSWELLSQSTSGSVLTLGVPDSYDLGELAERLESLGYEQPGSETGVWIGGDELIATIAAGASISPQFAHLAIDRDRHLVLTSDDEGYLEEAVKAVGREEGGGDVEEVAAQADEALSAVLLDSEQVCGGLAMSQADPVDQETAAELLAAAGDVNPLTGFALAAQPDGEVLAVMAFENEDQARTNADTRAELASGPAPGQGGDFSERFTLGDVVADGNLVTMHLEPVEGAFVLSDLSSGPLLFATC